MDGCVLGAVGSCGNKASHINATICHNKLYIRLPWVAETSWADVSRRRRQH